MGVSLERSGDVRLPRAASAALVLDHDAADEDLAAPHAMRLAPLESPGEAELLDRAFSAERLGLLQQPRGLGEEQVRLFAARQDGHRDTFFGLDPGGISAVFSLLARAPAWPSEVGRDIGRIP
jgi:hypothetical protein